jgi:GTPase KRas protein
MEYKCVLCGAGGVGKSALVIQYIQQHFIDEYDPTVEDSYRKYVVLDGESCMLDILDTAGQEEYKSMQSQYIRNGNGFILVYSIGSRESYEELSNYRDTIFKVKDSDDIPLLLVGNKCDLKYGRTIQTHEGTDLASNWKIPFLEASALHRINIQEIFEMIIRIIRDHRNKQKLNQSKQLKKTLSKRNQKFCTLL